VSYHTVLFSDLRIALDREPIAMNEAHQIFLCHAVEDRARVHDLHASLERAGLHPVIEDIQPRDPDHSIERTIQAARFVIICLSRHFATTAGDVSGKLDVAFQVAQGGPPGRVFIIPVRLDDCEVPARCRHLQHVDLFEKKGVDRIVQLIREELRLEPDPRDGQIYRTIVIGDQTWLAENMNYQIAGSWWYRDDPANAKPYGRLYTWEAARNACVPGWHLPDDTEWQQLARSVGGYRDMDQGYPRTGMNVGRPNDAFNSLIEGGSSGFEAVLGGYRTDDGWFEEQGRSGFYWSSTPREYFGDLGRVETAWAYYFYLLSGVPELRRDAEFPLSAAGPMTRRCALSVRCVRDK
jgi:uncharacterized protein (TIGR02145 family)